MSKFARTNLIDIDTVCRVCGSDSKFVRKLTARFILDSLEKYYGKKVPADIAVKNYIMLQCTRCSLEWGHPSQPGSNLFYEWITKQSRYYPAERWEWSAALDRIRALRPDTDMDILEIGCGSGRFLELARASTAGMVVGLDTTLSSVNHCRSKGLTVYCENIESFRRNRKDNTSMFDYAAAFHCLEHVTDPKDFIASIVQMLKPGGKLFISTPYSPMSFEGGWFDPLNNPPHHLTRWNYRAYEELARQLGLQINFIMPRAASILDRTLYALNLAWNGPSSLASRKKLFLMASAHPFVAVKEIVRQTKREKINGKVAADVVLVELSRNDCSILGTG